MADKHLFFQNKDRVFKLLNVAVFTVVDLNKKFILYYNTFHINIKIKFGFSQYLKYFEFLQNVTKIIDLFTLLNMTIK